MVGAVWQAEAVVSGWVVGAGEAVVGAGASWRAARQELQERGGLALVTDGAGAAAGWYGLALTLALTPTITLTLSLGLSLSLLPTKVLALHGRAPAQDQLAHHRGALRPDPDH